MPYDAARILFCPVSMLVLLPSNWHVAQVIRTHPPIAIPLYCFAFCSPPLFFKNSLRMTSVTAYANYYFEARN